MTCGREFDPGWWCNRRRGHPGECAWQKVCSRRGISDAMVADMRDARRRERSDNERQAE